MLFSSIRSYISFSSPLIQWVLFTSNLFRKYRKYNVSVMGKESGTLEGEVIERLKFQDFIRRF